MLGGVVHRLGDRKAPTLAIHHSPFFPTYARPRRLRILFHQRLPSPPPRPIRLLHAHLLPSRRLRQRPRLLSSKPARAVLVSRPAAIPEPDEF